MLDEVQYPARALLVLGPARPRLEAGPRVGDLTVDDDAETHSSILAVLTVAVADAVGGELADEQLELRDRRRVDGRVDRREGTAASTIEAGPRGRRVVTSEA
jgi:hypothetical protein